MGNGVSETHLVGGRVRGGSSTQRALFSAPPCRAGMDLTMPVPRGSWAYNFYPVLMPRLTEKAKV